MNFLEIAEDMAIDLDKVVDVQIIDVENKEDITNPKYVIVFTLNIVESVRVLPNSPDEDEYETSHFQTRDYDYAIRMTPAFNSYKDARRVFNTIVNSHLSKEKK